MSQRSSLEDKYTVSCLGCGHETIEPFKSSRQKYPKKCNRCGRSNKDNQKLARKK